MHVHLCSVDDEDRKEWAAIDGRHSNHDIDSGDSSDDAIDYFEDLPAEEGGGEMCYADFFDPPGVELPPDSNEYDFGSGDKIENEEEEASVDSDSEMGMEPERMNELEVDTEDEDGLSGGEDEEEGVAVMLSSHEERLARVSTERWCVGDGCVVWVMGGVVWVVWVMCVCGVGDGCVVLVMGVWCG